MRVTGIVCEYNPFHNGHRYHIEKTRKLCNSDYIIGVMSGCYTQRGTPAITDKYSRTRMALHGGCDVVIELPVRYSTASAEGFACAAIGTLAASGICDSVCFGSELGILDSLTDVARILHDEPAAYTEYLNLRLKSGESYPLAREHALAEYLRYTPDISYEPNNILAIEYIKACMDYDITPYTIKRIDSGYHNTDDTCIHHDNSDTAYVSAEYIRDTIFKHNISCSHNTETTGNNSMLPESVLEYIPEYTSSLLYDTVNPETYDRLIYYSLLANYDNLEQYVDMSEDIAARIRSNLTEYTELDSFIKCIKTKNYTYTRIMRALTHCLLGIKNIESRYPVPYIRILGFNKKSSQVMKAIQDNSKVPVITKPARNNSLDETGRQLLLEDINAAELYNHVRYAGTERCDRLTESNEYTHGLVIIDN